jgi:hypothetical protein
MMTTTHCPVACFIENRIETLGISHEDIVRKVGFEEPDMITRLKLGKTKLPYAKVSKMAAALKTDPVRFLKLCLSTYQPEAWKAIEPMMESTLSLDELQMIHDMREHVGGPYIAALTPVQKERLNSFLASIKAEAPVIH